MAALRHILLLQRDVLTAAKFYHVGLGLPVKVLTERWAELQAGSAVIALKAVEGEAYVTAGYTPFLSFEVKELQDSVQTLLSLGATLDGAIRYMDEGQVAVLRGPDGHMMSLLQQNPGGATTQ